jgi:hypothetical protein
MQVPAASKGVKDMFRIAVLLGAIVCSAHHAVSAPCTIASGTQYVSLGATGCTIGSATLHSFVIPVDPGVPVIEAIGASQVILNPTVQPDNSIRIDVDFGGFSTSLARATFIMTFRFEVPPPPFCCYIDGGVRFGDVIDTDGDATGNLGVGGTLPGGGFANQLIASGSELAVRGTLDQSIPQQVTLVIRGEPSPSLTLDPGDQIEFDSAYIQVNIATPEPGTGVLVFGATGLYLVGLLRRRRA